MKITITDEAKRFTEAARAAALRGYQEASARPSTGRSSKILHP